MTVYRKLGALCALALLAGTSGCHRSIRYTTMQKVSAFTIGTIALQVGSDQAAGKTGYDQKYLTLACKMMPKEAAAWANLGLLYLRRGEFDKAAADLKKAEQLAQANAQIQTLMGLLNDQRGNVQHSIEHYEKAVQLNPADMQARYALAQQEGRLNTPDGLQQEQTQLLSILQALPDNLFVLTHLAHVAAVRSDSATLQTVVDQLAAHSSAYTPDAQAQLKQLQNDIANKDLRTAAIDSIYLQNLLKRSSDYGNGSLLLQGDVVHGLIGDPLEKFVNHPNPPSNPAAPDMGLAYTAQPLPGGTGAAQWAGQFLLNGDGSVQPMVCSGATLSVGTAVSLPYPGGTAHKVSSPHDILAVDLNYDLKNDLVLAGPGGIQFYLQNAQGGTFTNVTAKTGLPASLLKGSYTGVWQADLNADGEIDLVLAPLHGAPIELQNDGDGTFRVLHPFAGITDARDFTWVDLDNSGNPDACFVDAAGKLHVFQNMRSGFFTPATLPQLPHILALANGDFNGSGILSLQLLTSSGQILGLQQGAEGGWQVTQEAQSQAPAAPVQPGQAQLLTGDLDNNGGMDIAACWPGQWQVFLCSAQYELQPLAVQTGTPATLLDATASGLLDFAGVNSSGQPVLWTAHSTRHYHWQELRPQPAKEEFKRSDYFNSQNQPLSGNRRINSFGIGGEMEARAGLLYEKQMMQGAVVHFGLGTYPHLDAVRIVWPNGDTRALFADQLKPDMSVVSLHFLKGSCPFLFVWNGKKFVFVTDCIWRSPLGLKIDAQDTAGIGQTTDWVKIPGSIMQPRNGQYQLRITAELWETHFFDKLGLFAVDHPKNTGAWVDERFAIPPPPKKVYATGPLMPVASAVDNYGNNVTALLRHVDGRYLGTFPLGRYQGVTSEHWVTLNLSNAPANKSIWLVCQGWIHPTDSSINVALGLSHYPKPQSLSLWTPDRKGKWVERKKDLGFPEGKVKTVLISLKGVFAPGAPHLVQLRTNLEIYWDAIRWAQDEPHTPLIIHKLPLQTSTLDYRGFSVLRSADPYSPELPVNYRSILTRSPRWRDLIGYYTRYGNVRPLLMHTDDRYVIMNAGDELRLAFPALPPPPPGYIRDFVLIGDGWVKDGDYNTSFSRTVLPLPAHYIHSYNKPPTHLYDDPVWKKHRKDWLTYQTRWVEPTQFMRGLRP